MSVLSNQDPNYTTGWRRAIVTNHSNKVTQIEIHILLHYNVVYSYENIPYYSLTFITGLCNGGYSGNKYNGWKMSKIVF